MQKYKKVLMTVLRWSDIIYEPWVRYISREMCSVHEKLIESRLNTVRNGPSKLWLSNLLLLMIIITCSTDCEQDSNMVLSIFNSIASKTIVWCFLSSWALLRSSSISFKSPSLHSLKNLRKLLTMIWMGKTKDFNMFQATSIPDLLLYTACQTYHGTRTSPGINGIKSVKEPQSGWQHLIRATLLMNASMVSVLARMLCETKNAARLKNLPNFPILKMYDALHTQSQLEHRYSVETNFSSMSVVGSLSIRSLFPFSDSLVTWLAWIATQANGW